MSFIGNQNVGVGTTNPLYHLDVSGNCHVTGNSYTLGSLGVGTSTPSHTLDISGNANINGTITNSGSIIKSITNFSISTGYSIGVGYQNPYSTPIFVYLTLVTGGTNVFYNIYTGSTSSASTFLGNGVLASGNNWVSFIVLPYQYWKIISTNMSIANVVIYN